MMSATTQHERAEVRSGPRNQRKQSCGSLALTLQLIRKARRFPSRSNRTELIADVRLSELQLHAGKWKRQPQQADNRPRFRHKP
jgi:hypothetical protein